MDRPSLRMVPYITRRSPAKKHKADVDADHGWVGGVL